MTATKPRHKKSPRRTVPVAAPRKELDPDATDLPTRFALHLRELIAKKKWTAGDFFRELEAELHESGEKISFPAVKKWLRGDGFPNTPMLEVIANVLGIADYRKVLPPPL